jgi:hypothetical protein
VHGLATIDAYQGEASARELERAVRDLGLKGVFIESAKGELLPDAPQARPTFLAAAELDIPVFLHPVPDATLRQKFKRSGKFSERLARSAINSAALLAMVHAGMFEEMDKLNVVVTALALGGLMVGECLADGARLGKHALPSRSRPCPDPGPPLPCSTPATAPCAIARTRPRAALPPCSRPSHAPACAAVPAVYTTLRRRGGGAVARLPLPCWPGATPSRRPPARPARRDAAPRGRVAALSSARIPTPS